MFRQPNTNITGDNEMFRKHYSMIKFLQTLYTSITLFLLTILSVFVFYSLHTVKEQFTAAQQQALNLYTAELNQSLENIASSLRQFQIQDGFADLTSPDSGELYRRKSNIVSSFSSNIFFLNHCDGLFLYDRSNDTYIYSFNSSGPEQTYNTRLKIKDTAGEIMQSSGLVSAAGWHFREIDGCQYLLYLQWIDDTCFGSWIIAKSLLPSLPEFSAYSGTVICLTDADGHPVASSTGDTFCPDQDNQRYIIARSSSATVPFTLYSYTPESHYLSTMSFSLKILLVVSIFSILTIAVVYISLKKVVKQPLNQVLYAITKYESGDFDYVPGNEKMPGEIIHINHAMANMSQEIKRLKIDVYEKQLRLKDIQLQYLQHQIKPHFVINILNTISLMVQMQENGKIIDIVHYLSGYMRNMMNLNIRTTTLQQELNQLENYLNLQRIRYPDQITVQYDIYAELESFQIPILTIQTLVENIFKHAMEPYVPLTICIEASVQHDQVALCVRDNGCGFPDGMMEEFNKNPDAPSDGSHIGLINIRQRLYLEYQEQASMRLLNDAGAAVIITLPYHRP